MPSRNRCLPGVLLLLFLAALARAEDPAEATPDQLRRARDAFAKIGAGYQALPDPRTRRVTHLFDLPVGTRDADLKKLPRPPCAFGLSLRFTKVTDAGLAELADLRNLTQLVLASTKVTDAGLAELTKFKKLTELDLFGTAVTDVSVAHLAGLKNLTELDLRQTKVTDRGVTELQRAFPKCKIRRSGNGGSSPGVGP